VKTEAVFVLIFAILSGVMTYAADWQREQDRKLSEMDKLVDRQKTILEMQIQINEKVEARRMFEPKYKEPRRDYK